MAQRKSTIRTVDKLTITFLVDNSIEWMTKLPPGFTHEVTLHLQQDASSPDEVTGVPVLNFDKFCCGTYNIAQDVAHLDRFQARMVSLRCSYGIILFLQC